MTTITSPQEAKPKLPNGPKIPPVIIMIQTLIDQFGTLEKFQKKYGDSFYIPKSSLLPPYVIFSNPQAIEKVFTADPNLFEVGKQTTLPARVLLGDNTLGLLDGVQHQQRRKLLMPPFHGERMKSYGQTMVDVTKEVISQWQVGQTIRIFDYTREISLRVILRTIFGIDEGEKFDRLKQLLVDWLNMLNSPLNSFYFFFPFLQKDLGALTPWGKFLKQQRLVQEILQTEIERRRNNTDTLGEDILSLMLSVRDEDDKPMRDDEIRDELVTMLLGGYELIAGSLAWSLYWLHYLPEVGQKLKSELNFLDNNKDYNTVIKLPYLSAVISETLRIHPVLLFVNRQLKKPFELMGYTFEAGTSLFPCIYLTHQREDIYPEPKKFKPERFLERQFSPYEYIPFGGGNRRCLGYAFAMFGMKLVLAVILSQVELDLLDNHPLKPSRRGFIFSPSGGVKMKVKASELTLA